MPQRSYLRGQGPAFYRGLRSIQWSITIDQLHAGWLDWIFHAHLREILLHVLIRFRLACPGYTCMPGHIHLFLTGLSDCADQRPALRMLRTELNRLLRPHGLRLGEHVHDEASRENAADRHSIQSTCQDMLNHPVRRGLSESAQAWPFQGSIFPGYPGIHPIQSNFWDYFWRAYQKATDRYASEDRGSSATRG